LVDQALHVMGPVVRVYASVRAARGADTLVFLTGDIGIGGGMLVDGRPLTGAGGYGGEFGHMRVNPRGDVCRCGSRGCWETEIGRLALMRNSGLDEDGDIATLLQRVEQGDRVAQASMERVADWLGIGLANLVNIVNPQVVVLGGHLRHVYEHSGPRVDREVERALTAAREQVRVTVTDLGGDATLIGAGELAFTSLLEDPVGILAACERAS
ncbi:MAG: ROK family protein, partial [bacterium]